MVSVLLVNDTTAPTTPTNLAATVVSTNQINLTWSASTDDVAVSGYKVYRNGTNLTNVTNSTNYADTGLSASTQYEYKVQAYDAVGNLSAYSNIVTATTSAAADTTAPSVPVMNGAVALSSASIGISWTASTDNVGVTGYKVYRNGTNLTNVTNSTNYTDSGLSANTAYTYNVAAYDQTGNTSAQSSAASATTQAGGGNLVAHWKLDEETGTTAADASGYGNNGTVYGATWSGGALSFNSSNQNYVNCSNSSALQPFLFTLQAWVKISSPQLPWGDGHYGSGVVGRDSINVDLSGYSMVVMQQQPAIIWGYGAGGSNFRANSNISLNAWYHIVGTYDGATMKIYINGMLDGTQNVSGAYSPIPVYNSSQPFVIGGRYSGYYDNFSGQIDDVKIYNYARTGAEIQAEYNAPRWVYISPATKPSARSSGALAYYSAISKTVLFGGGTNGGIGWLNATWEYDGANWTLKTPANKPSTRAEHAMVYNPVGTGKIVLFGGRYSSTRYDDTWEYDGANWTLKSPAAKPSARSAHAMAYDSARDKVVLFGGDTAGGWSDETWEYDGTNWTLKTPANKPSIRYRHGMAYDSNLGKVVLFGGNGNLNDTWEFDGTNWTEKTVANKPPIGYIGSLMAYDSSKQRVVLFGGGVISGGYSNDTYEWDGSNWLLKSPINKPTARYEHSITYDPVRNKIILFGGWTTTDNDETWEYSGQ
ncbi:MAG: fibronectin type III domain-containing protein [Planctomycetes bacterium]|nr:fibronectin type III domain-containing protein [Planctomycetota bacterium]